VKGSADGGAAGRSRLRFRRALSSGMWMVSWVSWERCLNLEWVSIWAWNRASDMESFGGLGRVVSFDMVDVRSLSEIVISLRILQGE
jgi:hypothetical protein